MIFVSFVFCFFFCFGRRLLASITLKWVVNGSLIFSSCYLALIVSQRENDNWRGRATQSPKTLKGGAANTAAGAFVTQGGSHYQQTKQRWRCVYVDVCVCVCAVSQIGRHFFVQTLADVAPLGNLRSLSVLWTLKFLKFL